MTKQERSQLRLQNVRDLEHSASEGRGLALGSLGRRRQRGHLQEAVTAGKAVTDMRAELLQHQAVQQGSQP